MTDKTITPIDKLREALDEADDELGDIETQGGCVWAIKFQQARAALDELAKERTTAILQALKNAGVDMTCGACVEVGCTGATLAAHTCGPVPDIAVLHKVLDDIDHGWHTDKNGKAGRRALRDMARWYHEHRVEYAERCKEAREFAVRIQELESQLSAQPKAIEWIAGGEGATDGDRELLVLDMGNGHTAFALAGWEDHRQRWLDDETDGQNDRLEWYPGQILWRAPIAALSASLPTKGPTDG